MGLLICISQRDISLIPKTECKIEHKMIKYVLFNVAQRIDSATTM
jgi:hypothetical protein